MILSNTTQAQQFLPSLNLTLANDRFNDFFRRAQTWLVSHIIGEELEEILEMEVALNDDDQHEKLRTLCQRVIAEKAFYVAIPEMDMQLTEAGFAVQNNENFTPASSQRVDRLVATLPERIANDVDALVRFLLKNSVSSDTPYSYWRGSDQFKYLTAAFIPTLEGFNKQALALQKVKTYDEFYAAIPIMAKEMSKVADYFVSDKEVCRLRELYRDDDALQIHRQAIAELKTVAVAAYCKDIRCARNAAVCARDIMMSAPDMFPFFKASDAYKSHSVNLDGGKTVNLL
jgi:hypothetical protein